jgi:hypothetical protein
MRHTRALSDAMRGVWNAFKRLQRAERMGPPEELAAAQENYKRARQEHGRVHAALEGRDK